MFVQVSCSRDRETLSCILIITQRITILFLRRKVYFQVINAYDTIFLHSYLAVHDSPPYFFEIIENDQPFFFFSQTMDPFHTLLCSHLHGCK